MTGKPRKAWSTILELAVYGRLIADHWAKQREQAATGPGQFYLGQRVRTTADSGVLGLTTPVPAGTLGTIASPLDEWGDYRVVMDNDPTGRRHTYGEDELAPAA